ncbi:MAG: hypothetical protein MUP98_18620 [Candidatus Aminicenantes bacterium]|nr:hypothetical protein [Candidatus Aminicenantes bacterium]
MKRGMTAQINREKGVVLIIAILVTFMMLILAIPFLTKLSGQYRITEKSFRQLAAFNLAEAGVERAVWELNYGTISNWEGDNDQRTLTISSLQASGGNEVGDIVINVTDFNGDNPVIQSTGRVPHVGSTYVEKQLYVVLADSGEASVFNYGVFGDEGVTLDSNAKIDSYDSRDGLYGGDNISWDGHTATNATHAGSIYIRSNGKIYGDALSGPGSDPETAIIMNSNAMIFGEKKALPSEKDLPIVSSPMGLASRGSYYLGSNNQATISESGEYSSFRLNSNADVVIQGNITMYVSGEFSMRSNTQLIISEGSSLTLYLGGTFEQNSNTKITNISKDPTKVQVYGTDSFESEMVWESNSDFYGAVYVPEADVEFNSNADFYGSIISKFLHMDSNGKIHYDLALGDIETAVSGESSSYSVKSWQEK